MRQLTDELVVVIDDVPTRRRKSKTTGRIRSVLIGPAAQGSKKAIGNGMMVEQSWKVDPWRKFVAAKVMSAMAGQEAFFLQPIVADFTFYMPRPQSHFRANGMVKETAPRYPISIPDVDKMARAIMDSVTAGEAWDDDARVVDLNTRKRYATPEHPVGVVIRLRLKEDDDEFDQRHTPERQEA